MLFNISQKLLHLHSMLSVKLVLHGLSTMVFPWNSLKNMAHGNPTPFIPTFSQHLHFPPLCPKPLLAIFIPSSLLPTWHLGAFHLKNFTCYKPLLLFGLHTCGLPLLHLITYVYITSPYGFQVQIILLKF